MSIVLNVLIYLVRQEKYIKNFDKEIAFIQTIIIEDFDSSAKKIVNNVRDIVCKSDRYYYI